jgi:pimeloyl-ACP methyl ester carboxylesterase
MVPQHPAGGPVAPDRLTGPTDTQVRGARRNREHLDAVLGQLRLGSVVLVAHNASGPPAIDWALAHPQRVAGLVLLNTYYCNLPGLRLWSRLVGDREP